MIRVMHVLPEASGSHANIFNVTFQINLWVGPSDRRLLVG